MPGSGPVIAARDVSKVVDAPHGRLEILAGIDLQLHEGESLAIVGASGSGKTTLLGLLAGLDLPTTGEIELLGQSLGALDEDGRAQLRNRRVGFVFQSFHLLPALSALENAMLPLELDGAPDARERALAALDMVGLSHRADHWPRQLSGGEQQRVAIARAFVHAPAVLFADEPTGNLDTRTGSQISDLMFDLNSRHATTLVLVTHDAGLARRCGRHLQLAGGRIEAVA